MTINEAQEKGLRYVRRPEWNDFTYLELPQPDDQGVSGPWTKLYDPIGSAVLKANGTAYSWPIPVLWLEWADQATFVEFAGERFTPDDILANKHIKASA